MDEKVLILMGVCLLASFIIKNAPSDYFIPVSIKPQEIYSYQELGFFESLFLLTKIVMGISGFVIGFVIGEHIFTLKRKLPVYYSLIFGIIVGLVLFFFADILATIGILSTIALILLIVFTPLGALIISLITGIVGRVGAEVVKEALK